MEAFAQQRKPQNEKTTLWMGENIYKQSNQKGVNFQYI